MVPLPLQAVNEIKGMLKSTGDDEYVFPPLARQKSPHLHRNALSAALRRAGLQGVHATHGFRAMFGTVARERLGDSVKFGSATMCVAHEIERWIQERITQSRC